MKKIFITWQTSNGINNLKSILDAFKKENETFDEILYLTKPDEEINKSLCHNNIKYEQLNIKLSNDKDFIKWYKKYFSKENKYIINISTNDNIKDIHIRIFAAFFIEKGAKNIEFIEYKNYNITKSTIEELLSKEHSPLFEQLTAILALIILTILLYDNDKSLKDKIIAYAKTGFSILLFGERGTGKSQIVKNFKEKIGKNVVPVNCASFADDTMTEAALFGHTKNAYTGAIRDEKGFFQKADNGILFLDEIHHLSKRVQAKLMMALQKDENNKMSFNKLGSTTSEKVEFILIVATNNTKEELREKLLSDFFDRIVQHVVELPPLRNERHKIEEHWEKIWKQLKFEEPVPKDKTLIAWLKSDEQKFWGNFRDLQKIALYYHTYNLFEDKKLHAKNALEYTKNEFEKWKSPPPEETEKSFFELNKTEKEITKKYHFEFQKWAIDNYGNEEKAAKKLNISTKTLQRWRNITTP